MRSRVWARRARWVCVALCLLFGSFGALVGFAVLAYGGLYLLVPGLLMLSVGLGFSVHPSRWTAAAVLATGIAIGTYAALAARYEFEHRDQTWRYDPEIAWGWFILAAVAALIGLLTVPTLVAGGPTRPPLPDRPPRRSWLH
jgi:hypothetical protein